jgi:hypothetical protein
LDEAIHHRQANWEDDEDADQNKHKKINQARLIQLRRS